MRIVVCGAGTAGCVVAARLSQDPANEVVLLEVGPHYRPGAVARPSSPTRTGSSRRPTTGATWPAPATRRGWSTCRAGGWWAARRSPTARSPCAATPSTTTSGTRWSTATTGRRWLPWFRAIESDRDFGGAPWHGDEGPIPISRYPRTGWLELQERFCEAALSVGHEWIDDHNAPGAVGIGPIPLNMVDGVRQTPADLYLDPALARDNLELRAGVHGRPAAASRRAGRRGRGGRRRRPRVDPRRRRGDGARHLRHPGGAPSLGHRPGRRARPPRHPRGRRDPRARAGDAGPPQGLLPLRPRPRGAALAEPLVPVPADRRPRGRRASGASTR